jgi:hypothetical protein
MIASVRDARANRIANTKKHDTIKVLWQPVRSASAPPMVAVRTVSQSTILTADPAAVIDQPRSTSIEGPKPKIIVKPILNKPHIDPAQNTAIAA